jgi:hypothetical protein
MKMIYLNGFPQLAAIDATPAVSLPVISKADELQGNDRHCSVRLPDEGSQEPAQAKLATYPFRQRQYCGEQYSLNSPFPMRVLLFENEKGIAHFIRRHSPKRALQSTSAGDGNEALDHINVTRLKACSGRHAPRRVQRQAFWPLSDCRSRRATGGTNR